MLALAAEPVRLQVLLTGFETSSGALAADAAIGLVALWYAAAVVALRRRGRRWPALSAACFGAGLALVFVGISSGLAAYDNVNFSAHVVQHVVLMMLAPPLIVLGRPLTLFLQSSPRRLQSAGARAVGGDLVRHLTGSVAAVAYYGFMWGYFFTPLYGWSVRSELVHDGVHGLLILLGLAYWQFVLAPDRTPHQATHFRRIGAIILGMPVEMYLGFALRGLDHPIGPGTTTASTQAGGLVFWWLSMLVSGIALAVAVGQWVIADERAALRLDTAAGRGTGDEWSPPSYDEAARFSSASGQAGVSRG